MWFMFVEVFFYMLLWMVYGLGGSVGLVIIVVVMIVCLVLLLWML